MKIFLMILSAVSMALAGYGDNGEDSLFGVFKFVFVYYLFFNPIGWVTMLLVGFFTYEGLKELKKQRETTDYTPMTEEEKREGLLNSLAEESMTEDEKLEAELEKIENGEFIEEEEEKERRAR